MKKKILVSILAAIFVFSIAATASMMIPANQHAKDNAQAPEKSPVIGDNWDLERVDFIHYAKPVSPGGGPKFSACYKLLGAKWPSLPVRYVINPSNPQGLPESTVTGAVLAAADTWDASTQSEYD